MCCRIFISSREPFIIYHLLLAFFRFCFFNKTNKNHPLKSIIFCSTSRFLWKHRTENDRKKFQHISTFRYISSLRFSHLERHCQFSLDVANETYVQKSIQQLHVLCATSSFPFAMLSAKINHIRPINFDNFILIIFALSRSEWNAAQINLIDCNDGEMSWTAAQNRHIHSAIET